MWDKSLGIAMFLLVAPPILTTSPMPYVNPDGSVELGKPFVRHLGSLPVKLISQNNQSCLAVSEYTWYIEQHNKRIIIKPVSILEPGLVCAITSLPSPDFHQYYAAVIEQKLCMISLDPSQDINTRTTHIGDVRETTNVNGHEEITLLICFSLDAKEGSAWQAHQ